MNLRRHPEDVFSVAWEGCMTNSNKQRNDIGPLPGQDHLYLGSAPVGEEHLDAATADVERPPQANWSSFCASWVRPSGRARERRCSPSSKGFFPSFSRWRRSWPRCS